MGLDISVISQMRPVEIPEDIELHSEEYYDWEKEQEYDGYVWNLYHHPHFTAQSEGLPDSAVVGDGTGIDTEDFELGDVIYVPKLDD